MENEKILTKEQEKMFEIFIKEGEFIDYFNEYWLGEEMFAELTCPHGECKYIKTYQLDNQATTWSEQDIIECEYHQAVFLDILEDDDDLLNDLEQSILLKNQKRTNND